MAGCKIACEKSVGTCVIIKQRAAGLSAVNHDQCGLKAVSDDHWHGVLSQY